MKDFKALTFAAFIAENFSDDTLADFDTSHELQDEEQKYRNYQHALRYVVHMLDKIGRYNSGQAAILVDRTVRKFDLDDRQRKALEIDIFDWENRDNDDMNAGIEEKHDYRHSPSNMKGYIDKIFKSGRSNVRNYQEFKIPIQK